MSQPSLEESFSRLLLQDTDNVNRFLVKSPVLDSLTFSVPHKDLVTTPIALNRCYLDASLFEDSIIHPDALALIIDCSSGAVVSLCSCWPRSFSSRQRIEFGPGWWANGGQKVRLRMFKEEIKMLLPIARKIRVQVPVEYMQQQGNERNNFSRELKDQIRKRLISMRFLMRQQEMLEVCVWDQLIPFCIKQVKSYAGNSLESFSKDMADAGLSEIYRTCPRWTRVLVQSGPLATNDDDNDAKEVSKKRRKNDNGSSVLMGGLQDTFDRILQWIDQDPKELAKFGIKPVSGILLYGPPGTGKTLLAKALSSKLDYSFYPVNGPEMVGEYVGEGEAKLRYDNVTTTEST